MQFTYISGYMACKQHRDNTLGILCRVHRYAVCL